MLFARCNYDGPEGGRPFHIGLNLPGYQPGQQCNFLCEQRGIHEFNTHIMPKIFDADFVPHARNGRAGAYCKCTAHGGSQPILKFHDYKSENCKPSDCWRKYLVALNFNLDVDLQVSPKTLQSSCSLCAEADECSDDSRLVHLDELASAMQAKATQQLEEGAAAVGAPTWDAAKVQDFMDTMQAENIILTSDGSPGSASFGGKGRPLAKTSMSAAAPRPDLDGKGPCDAKAGPFPRQCVVVPGENGDEWVEQLTSQGCTGNQLVVQLQDGVAVAISVLSVEDLLAAEPMDAQASPALIAGVGVFPEVNDTVAFTDHFSVRAVPGGVRIGLTDLDGVALPLDYAVSGSDVQLVFEYTQELVLQPSGAQVALTQSKPEVVSPSYVMGMPYFGTYSYSHKPMPPNILQLTPLEPSSYADACGPTSIALPGLGKASYTPPYPMP